MAVKEQHFTVGTLAELAGVNIETVRFYEREGVLPRPERRPSGHRRYRAQDVARLRFVQRAKGLGFTLREIRELLAIQDAPEATCDSVCTLAEHKLHEIDGKLALLRSMRRELAKLTAA